MSDPRKDRGRPPLPGRRPHDHRRDTDAITPSVAGFASPRHPTSERAIVGAAILRAAWVPRLVERFSESTWTDLYSRAGYLALSDLLLADELANVDVLAPAIQRHASGWDPLHVIGVLVSTGIEGLDDIEQHVRLVETAAAERRAAWEHVAALYGADRWGVRHDAA